MKIMAYIKRCLVGSKVRDYLVINEQFIYEYDYGDGWLHRIEYEGLHEKQPGVKYPICISGERACPPEDVGGVPGYEHFLKVIKTPGHPQRQSLLEWVGGTFDPEQFNPQKVTFDNPSKRWKNAFEREDFFKSSGELYLLILPEIQWHQKTKEL